MAQELGSSLTVEPRALTVTQLVRAVRETLEGRLGECWVVGEVSNVRLAASGHLYFTLKDRQSAINVVMFRAQRERLRFDLSDGLELLARGRVSLYEARGALQFYAEELVPRGTGALQLAFEQLKQRLAREGLFDPARKRALPALPQVVGIVTALAGRGLGDMLRILFARYPNLAVIVRPARVQGAGAAAEIAAALDDLNRDGRAAVIIVGRGGGSLEDLWAFNEETVARAIYRSQIPVVSAVGHEFDYSIADFVADVRAPTPTAAAQLVVPEKRRLKQQLGEMGARLAGAVVGALGSRHRRIEQTALKLRRPDHAVRQTRQRVDEAAARLLRALGSASRERRAGVAGLARSLRPPRARLRELGAAVAQLGARLGAAPGRRTEILRLAVRQHGLSLCQTAPYRALGPGRQSALALSTRLGALRRSVFAPRRKELGELSARLDSLSPLKVLQRGYAVVTRADDASLVTSAAAVAAGEMLDVRLKQGLLGVSVQTRKL